MTAAPSSPPKRSSELAFAGAAIALAGCAALIAYLVTRPPPPVAVTPTPPATQPAVGPPPVALVVDAARQLKLVTWSFNTTVEAKTISDKWYGDTVASVRAPVSYLYGVDLDTLQPSDVFFDAIGQRYVFVVAPPRRISVSVAVDKLEGTLAVSGLRWQSQNQDQLAVAQRTLAQRATSMQLSPADEAKLIEVSREQVERLLRRVLGDRGEGASVSVRFGR